MAKPINIKQPVAAIRASLELSAEEFAAAVGISVSNLKMIESGHRKVGSKIALSIALRVAVPAEAIELKSWTAADREKYRPRIAGHVAEIDDLEPLRLLPDLFALYYAFIERGIHGNFATMAIRREVKQSLKRWNVDPQKFADMKLEFEAELLGVLGSRQGIDTPTIVAVSELIQKKLTATRGRGCAQAAIDHDSERMEKLVCEHLRGRPQLLEQYLKERQARAWKKSPKGKGVFAEKADQLPRANPRGNVTPQSPTTPSPAPP